MANLIILRGQIDAGKTTTCGLIYENLIPLCELSHLFKNRNTDTPMPVVNSEGRGIDFTAILRYQGITIGIISSGDNVKYLRPKLNQFISQGVHTIICCTHTRDRRNSTFQMIEREFRTQHPVIHIHRIERIARGNFRQLRMTDVNEIINVVLSIQQ